MILHAFLIFPNRKAKDKLNNCYKRIIGGGRHDVSRSTGFKDDKTCALRAYDINQYVFKLSFLVQVLPHQ